MIDLESISDALTGLGHGLGQVMKRVFGSRNQRVIRRYLPRVQEINQKEEWAKSLSQEEMRARTAQWKAELEPLRERAVTEEGKEHPELRAFLDRILPEAFALVREASVRTLGMRHFDVQLIGGMVLHQGAIAEMATGEGKTLVATLPAYLNALAGKVYVVTVNDYLARRDADWMRPVYEYLGVSVGAIQSPMGPAERKPVYACDIVYGTNNEFGFDYLRDNMKTRVEDQVQKHLDYAIIDEVDSILIDEARTPLIISGPATGDAEKYRVGIQAARRLEPELHFELKEKEKQAILTEEGIVRAQELLGVEDFYTHPANMEWPHVIEQCLRALHLFKRDVDYVVKDGQVVIVDEFTGRLMEGRRWSDGLHQAVEASEGLKPRAQNQTLATITFQNYFRLFRKLAGMTGTAMTEAGEFARIYDLDVIAIPTNRPIARKDEPDVIYLRAEDKWRAIADEIEQVHRVGQPILVGTTSIETSEMLSGMLKRRGVPHEVLNAKHHEREAQIVAQAGRLGAVTVATNMAGRGTDIVLGGNLEALVQSEALARGVEPEDAAAVEAIRQELAPVLAKEKEQVLAVGGLYVLGTERHEARRIDNQLRGRSGRQGDPGRSRFFLSLDDDLMRKFYRDWVKNFLSRAGMGGGEPVESPMVSRAIEKAQKKVEAYHFEIRRNLLEYDEVMDKQRKLIYEHRQEALEAQDLRERVVAMFEEVIQDCFERYGGDGRDVPPDWQAICLWAQRKWGFEGTPEELEAAGRSRVVEILQEDALRRFEEREKELGEETMRELERFLVLNAIDSKWKDHLYTMDALRAGIGLRGYAQVDPKQEYKREGLAQFEQLLFAIADDVTDYILKVQLRSREAEEEHLARNYREQAARHPSFAGSVTTGPVEGRPVRQVAVGYKAAASRSRPASPIQEYARQKAAASAGGRPGGAAPASPPAEPAVPKVGRNEPCPCGSGRKYKQCHGKGR